jgi:hypothetical protein
MRTLVAKQLAPTGKIAIDGDASPIAPASASLYTEAFLEPFAPFEELRRNQMPGHAT